MEIVAYIYKLIDTVLMPFYRFPDNPIAGYYLGTFILAFASVIIGEYSISIAFRFNRDMISRDNQEMNHFQKLSLEALKSGDKTSFKACNGIANEMYGKSFFTQIALSTASLWPAFFALGWMQYRFSEVEFHFPFSIFLIGDTFGFFSSFIICYISTRIIVTNIRRVSFY